MRPYSPSWMSAFRKSMWMSMRYLTHPAGVPVWVLRRLPRLRQIAKGAARLFQLSNGLAAGGPPHRPKPRLAKIVDRLLPQFRAQGMIREPFRLLGDTL